MPQKYNNKVVIRKINIIDWESDAFKQAEKEFGLNSIPYLRIYGKDGKFIGEEQMDLDNLEGIIKGALK